MCACLGDDGWFFFHLRLAALSSWEQSIRMLYCMWTLHKFTLNSKKKHIRISSRDCDVFPAFFHLNIFR